jgi:hypothetical protein
MCLMTVPYMNTEILIRRILLLRVFRLTSYPSVRLAAASVIRERWEQGCFVFEALSRAGDAAVQT